MPQLGLDPWLLAHYACVKPAEAYRTGAYGLAPDPELVAHVRRVDYRLPAVDGAVLDRAARLVRERAGP